MQGLLTFLSYSVIIITQFKNCIVNEYYISIKNNTYPFTNTKKCDIINIQAQERAKFPFLFFFFDSCESGETGIRTEFKPPRFYTMWVRFPPFAPWAGIQEAKGDRL